MTCLMMSSSNDCLWPLFGSVYTAAGNPPYRGSLLSQPPAWLWRCSECESRQCGGRHTAEPNTRQHWRCLSRMAWSIRSSGWWRCSKYQCLYRHRSVVTMSWGKLYWPGRSAVICIPGGRWHMQSQRWLPGHHHACRCSASGNDLLAGV